MHPVLVYSALFIAITIGLLFFFEANPVGSIYLLLFIAAVSTAVIGWVIIKIFPMDDPMEAEIEKEKRTIRSNQYTREIQFLFNIVQPDPKFQPGNRRIGESLVECFELDEETIHKRLQNYFGESFTVSVQQSLPDLVEQIKASDPNWPE